MQGRQGVVRGYQAYEKRQIAVSMRKEPTPAERVLWLRLRSNKTGFHFRRQHVVNGFVVDFYCHAVGLVVEIDGGVHDGQHEADTARTLVLQRLGLEVLRFRNDEILQRLDQAVRRICEECVIRRAERA
jgi:very-short-patch-repair endonuclease